MTEAKMVTGSYGDAQEWVRRARLDGIRAALEAVKATQPTGHINDWYEGSYAACRAIERLIEAGKGRGE